jgi:methionyl-tRNA formyltransferase
MRVVFMATGPFAVPTLRRLYDSPHDVALVVTRPPREVHGKIQQEVNPVRPFAIERGTPVFEPDDINSPDALATLTTHRPDVLVVCDYGQILKPETLAVARLGGVNLHASLLPKYRGAAPINWAIYHGERQTGVSVIHMTPRLDAGPVIAQAAVEIGLRETAEELEPRLAELGAPLVIEAIESLDAGTARAIEQDPELATRAPRLKKSDGLVDWRRPAQAIDNQTRALRPWPKAHTFWQRGAGEPLRLILERVEVVPADRSSPPGTVLEAAGDRLVVAAGQDAVRILSIQPAGKRPLSASEFLRGYPVKPGDRFVGEPRA